MNRQEITSPHENEPADVRSKRTSESRTGMSDMGQNRKSADLFDHFVGEREH